MKIIDNRAKETTKSFSELKIGETFFTKSSDKVFMKTENFYREFDDDYWVDRYVITNAFCLNDGNGYKFYSTEKVIPINCECVIIDK